MLRVVACIAIDHNALLVALAAAICALAWLAYINMLGRAAARHAALRRAWVTAASVVFGCGVWATHFVAMMGFQTSVAAVYSLGPTAISLVLVIVGSTAASLAWVQGAEPTGKPTAWRVLAGVLIGASIVAMHFTGMAARQQAGTLVFDFDFVVTSIVIGISLSLAAMVAAAGLGDRSARVGNP
jgi:NO-binding membrane sensor protein with MHYT domain